MENVFNIFERNCKFKKINLSDICCDEKSVNIEMNTFRYIFSFDNMYKNVQRKKHDMLFYSVDSPNIFQNFKIFGI